MKKYVQSREAAGDDWEEPYLVRIYGHACGQANDWDSVEASRVGHWSGREVVTRARWVTHQYRIHLERTIQRCVKYM